MQFAPIITDFVMLSLLGERSDMYKDAKHSLATKELIRREDRHRIEDLFEHYDHDNRFAEHISRSLLSGGRGVSFMLGCSLRPCHTSACARARAQHTHTHTQTRTHVPRPRSGTLDQNEAKAVLGELGVAGTTMFYVSHASRCGGCA